MVDVSSNLDSIYRLINGKTLKHISKFRFNKFITLESGALVSTIFGLYFWDYIISRLSRKFNLIS